jgi:thiamine biosynthesis protein ThiI
VEKDVEKLTEAALTYLKDSKLPEPIRVETTRSDKNFPLQSPEISRQIGIAIEKAGYETALKGHASTIRAGILQKSAVIAFEKLKGPGGLPVGCSGHVICLLSGGIDSPVAALRMMKRGCTVDLLHFYDYPTPEKAMEAKIGELVGILRTFGFRGKVFLAPYTEFYKKTFTSIEPKKELVLFRRFILLTANRIAEQEGALGIASGDNLAQVASQTLENLHATNEASALPVYRPLIAYDKSEIIDLAKQYGTYETSIKEYKDCCSLVSVKHPETRAKLWEMKKLSKDIELEKIVEETLKRVSVF